MYKSGRYEFAMKYRYRQGTFYFVIQTSIFIANLLLSPAAWRWSNVPFIARVLMIFFLFPV